MSLTIKLASTVAGNGPLEKPVINAGPSDTAALQLFASDAMEPALARPTSGANIGGSTSALAKSSSSMSAMGETAIRGRTTATRSIPTAPTS